MRTSRPFSSICYLRPDVKLRELIDKQEVAFAAFIEHQPEEDETKRHFHVLVVPNKVINTNEFCAYFEEPDSDPNKPTLKWMPCRNSTFQDWYLYGLHHSGYLALKHQSRKFHYQRSDFWVSDEVYFKDCIDHIDWSKINIMGQIIEAAKSGINFANFIENFNIPLNSFSSAQKLWQAVCSDETFRNERASHDAAYFDVQEASNALYDAFTGEVLDLSMCSDSVVSTA